MNFTKLVSIGILATLLSSCSDLTQKQISKNCDELAVKFLKASHSEASKNGGNFAREVITVKNVSLFPKTIWKKGTITRYQIGSVGEVTKRTNQEYFIYISGAIDSSTTKPLVLTKEQIACRYKVINTTPANGEVPKWNYPYFDPTSRPQAGEEHTVTEDNDYIRWQ